ncbi:MAG: hypothetical protein B6229_00420 [Spirochaetaceae bacterium 4572_7]|nr:MAG: hypothetical protein B6229_00420 [Spirochaetaceae bacterium 4572_7]
MNTKELYAFRSKSMTKVKKMLTKKGCKITSITAAEKKSNVADFKLDGNYTKVKAAQNHNVNILFESINNSNYGWVVTTKAKWFIMYYEADEIAYIISVEKVRDYINNPLHIIPTTGKGARGNRGSESYMIPIDTLREYDIIVDTLHKE